MSTVSATARKRVRAAIPRGPVRPVGPVLRALGLGRAAGLGGLALILASLPGCTAAPFQPDTLAVPPGEPVTVEALAAEVTALKRALAIQEERLMAQERDRDRDRDRRGGPPAGSDPDPARVQRVQAPFQPQDPALRRPPVGQPPPPPVPRAEEPVATAENSVLTRPGRLVVEPSVEYQHTDINRFVVGGVAILDSVLIGAFEASQADRDAVTGTLAARYGLTSRLEAEVRVPYVYRADAVTTTLVETDTTAARRNMTENGLGDVELAGRYQINDGFEGWPIMVGNLRLKTPTGTGPFDVERDARGIETGLATGSGFWGVEPGLTVILPSDPVALYGTVGYLWNVARDIDERVGQSLVGEVNPGNAVRIGFGFGLGLNESVSVSLGYSHDFIAGTETEIDGRRLKSDSFSVGSLSLGVSYAVSPTVSIDVSVQAGVTEDAPDVRLLLKTPIAIDLL